MARPKKDEADVRRRWSVLNASRREREAIEAFARASGLSVSSYILRRALQAPVSPRQDWQLIVRQQAQLLHRLDEIAAALVFSDPVRDAGTALLALRRMEAQIAAWGSGSGHVPSSADFTDEDTITENADSGGERSEC